MECDGIGPDRAESIAEWFADEENQRLLGELRALGLRFEADEGDRPKEGPLTGRQYVITGTLESFIARGGEGGARGARREGLRQRLEEDDRRRRRREPGLEGREGAVGRRAAADRGGSEGATRRADRVVGRAGPRPHPRRALQPARARRAGASGRHGATVADEAARAPGMGRCRPQDGSRGPYGRRREGGYSRQ